ncbi:glutathione synthase [Pacificimonas sp. WHA3]|uniref:Glutathione synthetase n=1 Tax=Pacificimonas pallii TaxID=2827236 RepID=A0ABS6SAB2_9SPHN|nr:glutathione synthase [Pacificimonas pallii]MBV7255265.1 glutathione synthase [Pacificimonas pallii]
MTLNIAVQMDPMETVKIAGDSTFALMVRAQDRGHKLWHYPVESLAWNDGRVTAAARPVEVRYDAGNHFTAGETRTIDLGADIDVVLMRQDPPFDIGYITATHILEMIRDRTLIVNDPVEVRNAPEKLYVLNYRDLMPATLITRNLDEVRAFRDEYGAVVIKPLHGKGGEAVFKMDGDDGNLGALVEMFGAIFEEPFICQQFLPDVSAGDKRIILVDGVPTGAVNRLPKTGEIRSNFAAGGSGEASELTAREQAICARIGPDLKARGLIFVGIDVIGGLLTEINVTSPTGIVAIDRFNGTDTPGMIWDAIEARLK